MVPTSRPMGRFTVVVASALTLGLGSCTATPSVTSTPDTAAGEPELQIVTTFLPMTQFTKAVAGDRAEVVQLLPTNVGPHDYQAKPGDAQALAEADVLIQNGLELESFLDDLITNADNADLVIIDASEGIDTLKMAADDHDHAADDHDHAKDEAHAAEGEKAHDHHDHGADEAHAEGEEHAEGEAHAEGEEHAEGEGHHHHGEFDPHVWLDPKRAIEQVQNIRDGLIAADPEGEAEYTANAAAYIAQLQDLDAEITQQLAPYAGQTFISFHDFAFYFADSYDLKAEFLVDLPEENPSPEDVRRIIETTQAENIKALLTEPQAGESAFAALAKDLKVQISVFDPIETGDTGATEPDYYLTIMRQNADKLESALGGSPQSWLVPWLPQPLATLPQPIALQH